MNFGHLRSEALCEPPQFAHFDACTLAVLRLVIFVRALCTAWLPTALLGDVPEHLALKAPDRVKDEETDEHRQEAHPHSVRKD